MKKILIIAFLFFLNNCTGYSPIFSSNQIDFYIGEIVIKDDNKLIRKIIKNLKPFTENNNKKRINLELDLDKSETIILRDAKGDMASQETKLSLKVNCILPNNTSKKFEIVEKFTYNNQSNKFDLAQYKKSIEMTLIDKIYEDLIFKMRAL